MSKLSVSAGSLNSDIAIYMRPDKPFGSYFMVTIASRT